MYSRTYFGNIFFFFSLVLAMRLFHLWHLYPSTVPALRCVLCFCRLYVSVKLFADEKCADKMMIIIIPKSHMAPLPFGHITLHQCGLSRRLLCMCVRTRHTSRCEHCEYIFRFFFLFLHHHLGGCCCCSGFCIIPNLLLICACLSVFNQLND